MTMTQTSLNNYDEHTINHNHSNYNKNREAYKQDKEETIITPIVNASCQHPF